MDVNDMISGVGEFADDELTADDVEIIDCDTFPTTFFTDVRKWKRIDGVVALAGDLTNSTRLGFNRHTKTSARIYEAATGGAMRVVTRAEFSPAFVDIQGDGFFALFHGDKALERALCAAVSLKTFSNRHLVPLIEKRIGGEVPKTGFKAGMACGTLVVKNVGAPRKTHEPVWAGKAVNWAYKCAQAAEIDQLIVTAKVFDHFKANEYVRWDCGCSATSPGWPQCNLWSQAQVPSLQQHGFDCWMLKQNWCSTHGAEFCNEILAGNKKRPEDHGIPPDWKPDA